MVKYISTRGGLDGQNEPQSFEDVLLQGLAPDGGLYVPESWPQLDLNALKGRSYIEIAEEVIYPFVEDTISYESLRTLLNQTYDEDVFRHPETTPLYHIKNNLYALELFHGPTIAFKDVALQLLGNLFDYVLKKKKRHVTIIGATSGDTGSAAIEGAYHSDFVDIFILFPEGRVSDVQRRQMTTVNAPNVHCIALKGNFDDCQDAVKAMFNDHEFNAETNLTAVNSINWARIMAQMVYYVSSALALGAPKKPVSFVVPTGNFGNVYAAYACRQMGLPIKTLGVATNKNDILTRFFQSGTMKKQAVEKTISPSMDIQVSSNFERYLFDLLGRDSARLKNVMDDFKRIGRFSLHAGPSAKAHRDFQAFRSDDSRTKYVMKTIYDETGYMLDPHTAVGVHGGLELIQSRHRENIVCLACAHPAKFPDAVRDAIGVHPELPEHLSDLMMKEEKMDVLPNNLKKIQNYIRKNRTI